MNLKNQTPPVIPSGGGTLLIIKKSFIKNRGFG